MVEYVLLMLIAVGLSALLVSQLISRSDQNPGALIQAWTKLIDFVKSDQADDVVP